MGKFFDEYKRQLTKAVETHPDEYGFGVDKVPEVFDKMRAAILAKTYNKDGRAFKATCKALGIKHTYGAINAYVAENEGS